MTAPLFAWRQVTDPPPVAPPPAGGPLDRLDTAGFAATLAPLLGRAVGGRVVVQPMAAAAADRATPWLQIAELAATGGGPLTLSVSADLAVGLAQALFGGGMELADAGRIDALPPGNATWAVIAGLLAGTCTQALAAMAPPAASAHVALPVVLSSRAVAACPPPGVALLPFEIDIGGSGGRILLADASTLPTLAEETIPPPEPAEWRQRVRAQAMTVDLPVSLHLEDLRLPLAEVSALRPGDIIAIARPRTLAVVVAGRRIGSVSASRIAGSVAATTERPDESPDERPEA